MNQSFAVRENEMSVVGAMLQDKNAASLCFSLNADDFSDPVMKIAYSAIRILQQNNSPIDIVTVDTQISKSYNGQNPYTKNLIDAIQNTPTTSNIKYYISAVKEASLRRKLIQFSKSVFTMASDTITDPNEILSLARNQIKEISAGGGSWMSISDLLQNTYEKLEKRKTGEIKLIPTGIPVLDRAIGGIEKGEYVIIAARPSVGKSAIGAHIALAAAKKGYKIGIVSREMTSDQYGNRFISNVTMIPGSKLRTANFIDDSFMDIADAIGGLSMLPISFLFSIKSIEALRMSVQSLVEENKIDMLIVDYLQILTTEERTNLDYRRVALISQGLRDITRDFGIPVIALAQLSRPQQKITRTIPKLYDLRESGDLEQDADTVILMHRCEDEFDSGILEEDKPSFPALTENGKQYILLIIAKGRQCGTGKMAVLFDPETMRYEEIN